MSPMLLSYMCPVLLLTPILSALNQKVLRVWGDSWCFQVKKHEKHPFPRNFREKYWRKNGISGIDCICSMCD